MITVLSKYCLSMPSIPQMLLLPSWIRWDFWDDHTHKWHTQCWGRMCLKCCGLGRECFGLRDWIVCVCVWGRYLHAVPFVSFNKTLQTTHTPGGPSSSLCPLFYVLLLLPKKESEPEVTDVCRSVAVHPTLLWTPDFSLDLNKISTTLISVHTI